MSKRIFDVVMASLALGLLAPAIILLCAAVLLKLGRPIFFRQVRPGLGGDPFFMLKFRTMRAAFAADGKPLPDAERLTAFGRMLRATSLDELPELFCVLKGDMSLVGPRPLLMQYLPLYNERQALRHNVKPGVTGWAQVNGRNGISWEEKFELDVWYIENQSIMLDFKILALTVLKVLRRQDISAAGEATMHAFEGSKGQSSADSSDLNLSRK